MNKKYIYLLILLFGLTIGGYFIFRTSYAADDTTWQRKFSYTTSGSNIILTKYEGTASEVTVPATAVISGTTYNTVIDNTSGSATNLFAGNTTITKVTFENGVKAGTSLRYMFYGCSNLKTINFNNFNTASVTNMQQMFRGCSSLEKLDLSSFTTTNVTTMQAMFYGCSALKELNISSFDTANTTTLYNMFCGVSALNKIVLGSKMNFKLDTPYGYPFGRGTWKKDNGEKYAAVYLALNSAHQNLSGTYTKESDIIADMDINYPIDYRIDSFDNREVDFATTNNTNIKFTQSDGGSRVVYLDNLTVQSRDDYSISGTTTLLIHDAVVDNEGNRYNLKVTIDNIHIYNFTTDENSSNPSYEKLVIVGSRLSMNSSFFKNLNDLKASQNQIYQTSPIKVDITFSIVDEGGNPVNGVYAFSAYDLDVPSIKDASGYPSYLSSKGYGEYSEGINLLSGYDTTFNTLKMYNNTKLLRNGNRIFGTHIDEGTELSEFSIRVNADNFKFTWTGENCGTSVLYRYQPRIVEIAKKDDAGNFVSGAGLSLYQGDEVCNSSDEGSSLCNINWVTTSESKRLFLTPGYYTLTETTTPDGYNGSSTIKFYVDVDDTLSVNGKKVNEIVVTNQRKSYPYTVNYLDRETNEVIHEPKVVTDVKMGTEISSSSEVINITNYRYSNADINILTIKTSGNVINLYYERIKGGIVEKHVDEYSNAVLHEKGHNLPVDSDYDIPSKTFAGYRLVEERLPNNATGVVTEGTIEVVYYYHKVFKVTTKVENTGGTITGDEEILEGENSTEGKIVITPDDNHYISKVTVNGEEIEILDEKGFVVPNFLDMHEDKEVIVTFSEIVKNVPKTGSNTILPTIAGVFVFILLLFFISIKTKKKVLPME